VGCGLSVCRAGRTEASAHSTAQHSTANMRGHAGHGVQSAAHRPPLLHQCCARPSRAPFRLTCQHLHRGPEGAQAGHPGLQQPARVHVHVNEKRDAKTAGSCSCSRTGRAARGRRRALAGRQAAWQLRPAGAPPWRVVRQARQASRGCAWRRAAVRRACSHAVTPAPRRTHTTPSAPRPPHPHVRHGCHVEVDKHVQVAPLTKHEVRLRRGVQGAAVCVWWWWWWGGGVCWGWRG
jgi:hypothetical protein